ncbi:uncharacterized protein MYCFIDRAFT_81211 [Pseudocercospora fijiensis CIRAD86]|uniref:DhaL domain-containing protein n=1 Tax=Pseudocercospora fijiensis (strain CIRAD86) TaxID=383855 RepID=M2ZL12_PSEFD|nr:uncharacterized protein MYCFIDRAFT_81211 [Pseudocercospora fijiensis CIRAD86]EME79739.1 hypothetical protein MYCFIDRAFT_81211 [Pseudocercospora fijiensis CIRAD86]
MAVVVEQTIPFDPKVLDIENPSRWNGLFPLIRPAVKATQTAKGQTILVDTSKANSKNVHIVAIGKPGNFSSKLLDEKHVTAIVTEQTGAGILHPTDLPYALENAGIKENHGVVVVRLGKKRNVDAHNPDLIEVVAEGELEQDHLLQLLGTATDTARSNVHHISDLLKAFAESVSTAHSTFHTEKVEGNPAVLHADGPVGFEKAKDAVERDLKHAMKSHTPRDDTILNHTTKARGFSISIASIPSAYLSPSPKPTPHKPTEPTSTPTKPSSTTTTTTTSGKTLLLTTPQILTRIQTACHALITSEPTITEYDTIVGDGDCGQTLRSGAQTILNYLSTSTTTTSTPLPELLTSLVSRLELDMGGTSGALYCIYATSLSHSLRTTSSISPQALSTALKALCNFTKARKGDRTVMDVLMPFCEVFEESLDAGKALEAARLGMEGTRNLRARLGRSAYLDEKATRGVPDPGAFGLWVVLGGLCGEGGMREG